MTVPIANACALTYILHSYLPAFGHSHMHEFTHSFIYIYIYTYVQIETHVIIYIYICVCMYMLYIYISMCVCNKLYWIMFNVSLFVLVTPLLQYHHSCGTPNFINHPQVTIFTSLLAFFWVINHPQLSWSPQEVEKMAAASNADSPNSDSSDSEAHGAVCRSDLWSKPLELMIIVV